MNHSDGMDAPVLGSPGLDTDANGSVISDIFVSPTNLGSGRASLLCELVAQSGEHNNSGDLWDISWAS